jgi:hypothetical protein
MSTSIDRSKWFQPSPEWTEEERVNVADGLRETLEHKVGQGQIMSAADALGYFSALGLLCKADAHTIEIRREHILRLANFTHAPVRQ